MIATEMKTVDLENFVPAKVGLALRGKIYKDLLCEGYCYELISLKYVVYDDTKEVTYFDEEVHFTSTEYANLHAAQASMERDLKWFVEELNNPEGV